MRNRLLIILLILAMGNGAWAAPASPTPPPAPASVTLTSPAAFLVDKHDKLIGVVQVLSVRDDWIVARQEGNHIPVMRAKCRMISTIEGAKSWANGTEQEVLHVHMNEILTKLPTPALMEGSRYLLFAEPADTKDIVHTEPAKWIARPQGFLRLHGPEDNSWYAFDGQYFSLEETRKLLVTGAIIPLDEVPDPSERLAIAEGRLNSHVLGPRPAFLHGLLKLVVDAPGEMSRWRNSSPLRATPHDPNDKAWQDEQGRSALEFQFRALALLRLAGSEASTHDAVCAAFQTIIASNTANMHLPAAVALAQLGRSEGKKVLLAALTAPAYDMMAYGDVRLPNLFPFGDSSRTAAAYALGLIGDDSPLASRDSRVVLANAVAFATHPPKPWRAAVAAVALRYDPILVRDAQKLRAKRAADDYIMRLPLEWLLARSLLSRIGDDDSLRRLVHAWLVDENTFPINPDLGNVKTVKFTHIPSGFLTPEAAILCAAVDRESLLKRMRRVVTPHEWDYDVHLVELRRTLGDTTVRANAPHDPRHQAAVALAARAAAENPRAATAPAASLPAATAQAPAPPPSAAAVTTSSTSESPTAPAAPAKERPTLLDTPAPASPTPSASPIASAAATPAQDDDMEKHIDDVLASTDPKKRAQGLAAAGFNRIEALYPRVLQAALTTKGDELTGALYGLSWYQHPLSSTDAKNLMTNADTDAARIAVLELLTRTNPQKYATETMDLLHHVLSDVGPKQQPLGYGMLLLVLTRMSRGNGIPPVVSAGLNDPDERVRAVIVRCLAFGGNPAAAQLLRDARQSNQGELRDEIDRALIILGPDAP